LNHDLKQLQQHVVRFQFLRITRFQFLRITRFQFFRIWASSSQLRVSFSRLPPALPSLGPLGEERPARGWPAGVRRRPARRRTWRHVPRGRWFRPGWGGSPLVLLRRLARISSLVRGRPSARPPSQWESGGMMRCGSPGLPSSRAPARVTSPAARAAFRVRHSASLARRTWGAWLPGARVLRAVGATVRYFIGNAICSSCTSPVSGYRPGILPKHAPIIPCFDTIVNRAITVTMVSNSITYALDKSSNLWYDILTELMFYCSAKRW
jgi:hypothetical protein